MEIKISSVRFDADSRLEKFIENKVNKLEQYYDHIIHADVTLRVEKRQSEDNKIAEIKLELPGTSLFAKKQCNSFEEATDSSVDAIKRQLKKHKDFLRKK
jgi:putative sigma-54 modulation protein